MAKPKPKQKGTIKPSQSTEGDEDGRLKTIRTKEQWNKFFTDRTVEVPLERLADWPELQSVLLECLSSLTSPKILPADLPILVPACGSSRLSENLYDAGFTGIMNVDFSSAVIEDMLKRNVKDRPEMKWRVMDMTKMKILDGVYGAIVDKGGFTTLMEADKNDQTLCSSYFYEVKRILKTGGKFICVTSAETRVLEQLFRSFRCGWKMNVHGTAQDPSSTKLKKKAFVVVAEKENLPQTITNISSVLDDDDDDDGQARNLRKAVGSENKIRDEYKHCLMGAHTLDDLKHGAKGNLSKYERGRVIKFVLADSAISTNKYSAILLDYKQDSAFFIYHFGVCIVPQLRYSSWLHTSEDEQWRTVANTRVARLLMVFLDCTHSNLSMEDANAEIIRLSKSLAPGYVDENHPFQVQFLTASDEVRRKTLRKVKNELTGEIHVEQVIYVAVQDTEFRSLSIKKNGLLFSYETSLSRIKPTEAEEPTEQKASSGELEISHSFLSCQYHFGVVAGTLMVAQYLILRGPYEGVSKVVSIGLGAGLLPMFVTLNHEGLNVEVVELDPEVLEVAEEFFSFKVNDLLKVHKVDGDLFVKKLADSKDAEEKIDILILDATKTVPGVLSLPHPRYVEESFIEIAYESLADKGMFVMNLMSSSTAMREDVLKRLQKVFSSIFRLKHEQFSEVVIALKTDEPFHDMKFSEAVYELAMVLKDVKEPWSKFVNEMLNRVEVYKGEKEATE